MQSSDGTDPVSDYAETYAVDLSLFYRFVADRCIIQTRHYSELDCSISLQHRLKPCMRVI